MHSSENSIEKKCQRSIGNVWLVQLFVEMHMVRVQKQKQNKIEWKESCLVKLRCIRQTIKQLYLLFVVCVRKRDHSFVLVLECRLVGCITQHILTDGT